MWTQYDVQQLMKFVDSIEPPAVAGENVGYVVSPPIPDRLQSSSQSPTISAHVIDVCVRLLFRFVNLVYPSVRMCVFSVCSLAFFAGYLCFHPMAQCVV